MADIIVPQWGQQITPNGIATQELLNWMADVTEAVNNIAPLTGTGSPEGVIIASVGRWYVDTGASPADIYFKATGDGDTGWVLT